MSNAAAVIARVKTIPRPSPRAVAPMRPRVESLADTDFALVEEPSGPRAAADEILSTLFEKMHDLELLDDALDGARFCLGALASVIPCRSSLVHLYDAARRDFLVVDARGEAAESMALCRQSPGDPLFRVAMPMGRPFSWTNLRNTPVRGLARFSSLPHVNAALLAPVVVGKRWLGAIELVDPLGGGAFRSTDENAAAYVAERYAAFLATRGVIVDVSVVARFVFK